MLKWLNISPKAVFKGIYEFAVSISVSILVVCYFFYVSQYFPVPSGLEKYLLNLPMVGVITSFLVDQFLEACYLKNSTEEGLHYSFMLSKWGFNFNDKMFYFFGGGVLDFGFSYDPKTSLFVYFSIVPLKQALADLFEEESYLAHKHHIPPMWYSVTQAILYLVITLTAISWELFDVSASLLLFGTMITIASLLLNRNKYWQEFFRKLLVQFGTISIWTGLIVPIILSLLPN